MSSISTSTTIDDRVARLERRVRSLSLLLLVVPSLAFLLGAAAEDVLKAKVVSTQRLVIVDADGKGRIALYTGKKGDPVLEMYNADGSLLLNGGKSDDNGVGFMQFYDSAGKYKGGVGGNAFK